MNSRRGSVERGELEVKALGEGLLALDFDLSNGAGDAR